MRYIDVTWLGVDRGAVLIDRLERDLERWRQPIREERERRARAARAHWQAAEDARWGRHQAAISARKAREASRLAQVERERVVWAELLAPGRKQLRSASGRSARIGAVALPVALVAVLVAGAAGLAALAIVLLAGLLAALPALHAGFELETLRRQDPGRRSQAEPEPAEPPPALLPAPEPAATVPHITSHWWTELARHRRPPRPAQHGDAGVDRFVQVLSALPDDYVMLREIPVTRSLDVDVLVLGPSGAWLFEVKHWSGRIECSNGTWSRVREYYAPGGHLTYERRPVEPFDEQWVREREAVAETLRRRLQDKAAFPNLQGGIVFSHPRAGWKVDGSCRSGYGPPGFWLEEIRKAPPVAGFTRASQLAVLDALVRWGHKVDERVASRSGDAAALAEHLHRQAAAAVTAYLKHQSERTG